ncbi:hypothetical protein F5887DRAFT_1188883 [Amanita rubescens]|nr:hypothetical protein F5887DRAFT_1188883 [Amanita rubescens]
MVNIYLHIEDRQVLPLSIPFSDIERLSVRPAKWLRFVTFAICGVRGDLSAMPNGPPVDYDSISLHDISETYYCTPEGDYHLIDHNAKNDRITCHALHVSAVICDAAHLLAKSKGDEYIGAVLQDRLNSYDPALGINSVENGMFLSKNLHASLALGSSAFLKTPNFALDPTDIPRVEADPTPPSRITLHHLKPDTSHDPILQHDARIAGTGISPPSTIILDFTEVMQRRFAERYESIPIPPASPHSSDDDSSLECDDLYDDDECISNRRPRGRNHSSKMSDEMLQRQKREEAEELRAQEASRAKVQQWMQSSPSLLPPDLRLNRPNSSQTQTRLRE